MSGRLEVLKSLLEQKPEDSFVRYGLAMEYARLGRLEEAAGEFAGLLERNPEYVPGYFHAGQTLEKLGRLEEAAEVYRKGIEVTGRLGAAQAHAHSELQAALDILAPE